MIKRHLNTVSALFANLNARIKSFIVNLWDAFMMFIYAQSAFIFFN